MDWSGLPTGLIAAIADKLTDGADLASFRSVCPSWRLASAARAARLQVPLLLLPPDVLHSDDTRGLLSISHDRLVEVPLPEARGRSFLFASTHGWVLGVAPDLSTTLLHPISGVSIDLPTLPASFGAKYHHSPRDMVWDWSPHAVIASLGSGAVFCRFGDHAWTSVAELKHDAISSIDYCHGVFYLLEGSTCAITVVDAVSLSVVTVIPWPPALRLPNWRFEANLVVSSEEVLLLVRTMMLHPGLYNHEMFFKAFRRDRRRESADWTELAGIADRAVFVDHFRAFCVEANEFNGLRRNCMYFASAFEEVNDDYGMDVYGRYTVSVLDFADLKSERLRFEAMGYVSSRSFWQWPSWAMPRLA